MKVIFSLIISFLIITNIFLQEKEDLTKENKAKITVNINNFESNEGQAIVTLFDSKENWLKNPVDRKLVKITNNSSTVVFDSLDFGTYGVSVIHDDNDNSEMDTNFLGMPSEDYGFSNDAEPSFGPPSWEDAEFSVDKPEIRIDIKIQ